MSYRKNHPESEPLLAQFGVEALHYYNRYRAVADLPLPGYKAELITKHRIIREFLRQLDYLSELDAVVAHVRCVHDPDGRYAEFIEYLANRLP